MCCSQFLPMSGGPFPWTTSCGNCFSSCWPCCTFTNSSPTTLIGSPVYVLRLTGECCSWVAGNIAFLVVSDMIETAAPVSNSIGGLLPLISMSTLIRLVTFSPKVNKGKSPSLSASVVSSSTNFVFSGEFLLFDHLGSWSYVTYRRELCAPPCHNCGMLPVKIGTPVHCDYCDHNNGRAFSHPCAGAQLRTRLAAIL